MTLGALALRIGLGFVPVLVFSLALYLLDNYKLVKPRAVVDSLLAGVLAALVCLLINSGLIRLFFISFPTYSRYLAPPVEELVKAAYLVYLFRRRRVGFMVDAAILGFAVGAGFALFENTLYLLHWQGASPLHWMIRGFGTAVMHGGNVALVGILAKGLADRRQREAASAFLPGLLLATAIHALYNHLQLNLQFLSSVVFIVLLPVVVGVVFGRSERSLRRWLDVGFSSDVELLGMISTGTVLQSRLGNYLQSLRERIPGEVLADMLCYLRLFVELAIKAKGILLLCEAGFPIPADSEVQEKFRELRFLERSIGRVGKRILSPFLHVGTRELWQLHMLQEKVPGNE